MSKFNYVLKRIKKSKIIKEPFPHIEIGNFLKKKHYEELLQNLLIKNLDQIDKKYILQYYPGAKLENLKLAERPTGLGLVFKLKKESYSSLMKEFDSFLISREFIETICEKLNASSEGWNLYEYNKDLNGYEISPHPDVTGKLVTYQINFSDENLKFYNLSTRLHSIKEEAKQKIAKLSSFRLRPWGEWHWFDVAKQIHFRKNNFFAFAPSSTSYHSVKLENYPENIEQRTMLRGFIASNELLKIKEKSHWHSGNITNFPRYGPLRINAMYPFREHV